MKFLNIKLDKSAKTLMKSGIKFSFFILIISSVILAFYDLLYPQPDLFYIGLSVFRMGITYIAFFIACGFTFTKIKEEFDS